jgi:hypothetical protein
MRFKLFPRLGKQKTLRSRPATPPDRKYYLGATIMCFLIGFGQVVPPYLVQLGISARMMILR